MAQVLVLNGSSVPMPIAWSTVTSVDSMTSMPSFSPMSNLLNSLMLRKVMFEDRRGMTAQLLASRKVMPSTVKPLV